MAIKGTAANDTLDGTAAKDKFKLDQGGDDTATGQAGNDSFIMGGAFSAADALDGGTGGGDKVVLNGNYSAAVVFNATTMANIETLRLSGAFDYNLTTHNATVAAGARLTVAAAGLGVGHDLIFNGAAETDGRFKVIGSDGADTITGGAQADVLVGGGGADVLAGGAGADTFIYEGAVQSTSITYDAITGFNASADVFDFDVAVTGFNGVVGWALTTATLDTDLTLACGLAGLGANHAIIISGEPGSRFNGKDYLVVDATGDGLYTAGLDYVIEITNFTGTLDIGDFI